MKKIGMCVVVVICAFFAYVVVFSLVRMVRVRQEVLSSGTEGYDVFSGLGTSFEVPEEWSVQRMENTRIFVNPRVGDGAEISEKITVIRSDNVQNEGYRGGDDGTYLLGYAEQFLADRARAVEDFEGNIVERTMIAEHHAVKVNMQFAAGEVENATIKATLYFIHVNASIYGIQYSSDANVSANEEILQHALDTIIFEE